MERETLIRLEKLNQLALTEEEKVRFLSFIEKRDADLGKLDAVDTEGIERMVHCMPISTVVREDTVKKDFSRDELQKGAPETLDGYWQVPRLVE